jgi:hypothetical protein
MTETSGPNRILGPNPEGALWMGSLIDEAGTMADEKIADDYEGPIPVSVWDVYDKAGFTRETWEHVEATGTTPKADELAQWLVEECQPMIKDELKDLAEEAKAERYIANYEANYGVKYEG